MVATYTPANASLQGTFPFTLRTPNGVTWDGLQLVIVDTDVRELWTLARNPDGTYTPGNASLQGIFPGTLTLPTGVTWDGQQLVIADTTGSELWTLARNADGSYTPGNAVNQGAFGSSLGSPVGMTWDGQQLVISDPGINADELWTLARNADGSYTPGNAVSQDFFTINSAPSGLGWDGEQLLIVDQVADTLSTLARNGNGSYTPGNVVNQGSLPGGIEEALGVTWDGLQLVIVDNTGNELWTLPQDNAAPTISAVTANPTIIDHGATSALAVTAADPNPPDTLTYQWTSDVGGTFSAPTSASTNWTAPSGMTGAFVATLSVTVEDDDGLTATMSVQVTVREMGTPPLALPAVADMSGATGDVIDVVIASTATGGRSPYTYSFTNLPPETGAVARRIRGRLITPGTFTVTMTVTDANGDTASRDFDWVVTGVAILPPTGINVRIDWGDASFSRAEADVTGRIRSGITCRRGRTFTRTKAQLQAGTLSFELDNSDGLYDQENTASTLHGQIRPGIAVQLRDGGGTAVGGRPRRHTDRLCGQRPAPRPCERLGRLLDAHRAGFAGRKLVSHHDGAGLLRGPGAGGRVRHPLGHGLLHDAPLVGACQGA